MVSNQIGPSDRQLLKDSLSAFEKLNLFDATLKLFSSLGYESNKRIELDLRDEFTGVELLHDNLQAVKLIFQLTSEELGHQLKPVSGIDRNNMQSYLLFAVELKAESYSRSQLAFITREINKLFKMPVLVMFKHGKTLTFSIIDRRLGKRDENKDVLEKVTLIKDINYLNPHRAHLDILLDLSFENFKGKVGNFKELHEAWKKVLSTSELNKKFYKEIANWYFWAQKNVKFPKDAGDNATCLIRLITRLIFVWFVKEKGLIPAELFNEERLKEILSYSDPDKSGYYKAILQNLFFACLNTEMGRREFRKERETGGMVTDYMVHNKYRYKKYFTKPDRVLELFNSIPFVNGGLFECLDYKDDETGEEVRIDGFSDRPEKQARVPDELFFGGEQEVDISGFFDGELRYKAVKVRGLIKTLESYKFTVAENTPLEEEVALDPELLGKVFENLLAAYNPETATTARKATGSYYTPREIVDYMVNESVLLYLQTKLGQTQDIEKRLRILLLPGDKKQEFTQKERQTLVDAIYNIKVIDPACGSGAFLMGVLHKLVHILKKLDPENQMWKEKQLAKLDDVQYKEYLKAVESNPEDYGRKLALIQNCIYGVDIQPIAVQIAKLRFFISLIVDQDVRPGEPNLGILPLPNLETKFVAANALIGLEKPKKDVAPDWREAGIKKIEDEILSARKKHFTARSWETKKKYRKIDKELRKKIRNLLLSQGFPPGTTNEIACWDPYDQKASAGFFDPEWMFGIRDGFDVVIGNPPYVNVEEIDGSIKKSIHQFKTAYQRYDLYVLFYEKSISLLNKNGNLMFISSNKFLSQGYGFLLRKYLLTFEIRTIINFNFDVFESAIVRTCIFQLIKRDPQNNIIRVIEVNNIGDKYKFLEGQYSYIDQAVFNETDENNFRINLNREKIKLLNKIRKDCLRLENICSVNYGLRPSSEKINKKKDHFIKNTNPKGSYKGYFEGKDMGYWRIKRSYFIDYRPDLMYNPMFVELFENVKLVGLRTLSDIGKLRFIYDDEGLFCNDSVVILTPWYLFRNVNYLTIKRNLTEEKISTSRKYSITYLQAILNSKLIKFYVNELLYDGTHFYPDHMKSLPIKISGERAQQPFDNLVNEILNITKGKDYLTSHEKQSKVIEYERQIDQLVYKLYGLTEEEIKIVENSFK